MASAAVACQVFARHPGRRARAGPVRRAFTTHAAAAVAMVAVAAIVAGGVLAAGHPNRPRPGPRCVPWHTCGCRFPGSGKWPGANQLCLANWGRP